MTVFVDHIEVPVLDINRAKEFLSEVFDWKELFMDFSEDYVLVSEEDPNFVSFGLYKVEEINSNAVIPTMRVGDINKTLEYVKEAGGQITREKYEIAPEIGHGANFKDPFGNTWGLHTPPNS